MFVPACCRVYATRLGHVRAFFLLVDEFHRFWIWYSPRLPRARRQINPCAESTFFQFQLVRARHDEVLRNRAGTHSESAKGDHRRICDSSHHSDLFIISWAPLSTQTTEDRRERQGQLHACGVRLWTSATGAMRVVIAKHAQSPL